MAVFVIVRSGPRRIVVASTTMLFPAWLSDPPVTMAVLVTTSGAVEATFTVSVMGGYWLPAARASLRVHVAEFLEMVHVQPMPLAAVGTRDGGRLSTTVTGPAVDPDPTLLAVMV